MTCKVGLLGCLMVVFFKIDSFCQDLEIITTSSTEFGKKAETSIYPAFVDGTVYNSWTLKGCLPYFQMRASGGIPPFKWEVVKGKLPTGMSMNQDGKLSGLPVEEGTFDFFVKLIDARGNTVTKKLNFVAAPFRSKWMAEAKFGIMIQWGAFTSPVLNAKEDIPLFEQRIKNFNADKWVDEISKLGGKVLNFSVKGGDGIRLWPSTTPSCHELKTKRNIVGELIAACHKKGIKFVAYFAPDNSWNKIVMDTDIDCASTSSGATLNKGLIKELLEMGVDGLWIDMAASPELYPGSYGAWFPWNEIIPLIRFSNPYAIFANNPGVHYGGTVLRWPFTDVLVYEGRVSSSERALQIARPAIVEKKIAIEVDNMLDNSWWSVEGLLPSPKSASMIIENLKKNWEVGATVMLNYPVPADGNIMPANYTSTLKEIGKFVKANQGWSEMPVVSLESAEYENFKMVSMRAKYGASIYYTTNGDRPTSKSRRYTRPIKISQSTRLRAIALEPGKKVSKVLDRAYGISGKNNFRSGKKISAISKSDKLILSEFNNYYRGMKITVGKKDIVLNSVGRKFVSGNREVHKIFIQRLFDQYPLSQATLNTNLKEIENDGYQYVSIAPIVLEAGKSYLVTSQECVVDKYVSNNFTSDTPHPDYRIAGNAILSYTGDRVPVTNDGVGAILNLKYNLLQGPESKNIALGVKTALLGNNNNNLIPSIEIQYADNAVDGDSSTHAQAGGEYPWTLFVDLGLVKKKINRMNIYFCKEYYATEFEVFYSENGSEWKSIFKKESNVKLSFFIKLPSITARYFKVRSYKPDAPNQNGEQMGIAEFQLYH